MTRDFDSNYPLRVGRVHEATGPAAYSFAVMSCALGEGDALWFSEGWRNEQLNPAGFAAFCPPEKLLVAAGKNQLEVLALCEEALRSGAVSTVVAELAQPLDLTAGRRLQLAAEAGKTTGIIILPEEMGSNAAETRWHCAPVFDASDSTLQSWQLIKNKSGTLGSWNIRWDAQAHSIIVVSKAGERAGSAEPGGEPG